MAFLLTVCALPIKSEMKLPAWITGHFVAATIGSAAGWVLDSESIEETAPLVGAVAACFALESYPLWMAVGCGFCIHKSFIKNENA